MTCFVLLTDSQSNDDDAVPTVVSSLSSEDPSQAQPASLSSAEPASQKTERQSYIRSIQKDTSPAQINHLPAKNDMYPSSDCNSSDISDDEAEASTRPWRPQPSPGWTG